MELLTASDSDASYAYQYDGLGQTTQITHNLAGLTSQVVMGQAFDVLGNRTSLSASIGGTADFKNEYSYDALSRLTRVTQGSQTGGNAVAAKRVDIGYNADGQRASLNRYSDLAGTVLAAASSYAYDAIGRLTDLTHSSATATIADYTWSYDAAHRVTSFLNSVHTAENATYNYDASGQLTSADRSGTTADETYTYDSNGNRVTASGNTYSTGSNNRLLSDGTYNYTCRAPICCTAGSVSNCSDAGRRRRHWRLACANWSSSCTESSGQGMKRLWCLRLSPP